MESTAQQLGSPSFLIVLSSATQWASESPLKAPSLQKSVLMAEQFTASSARDDLSRGAYALRSQDETVSTAAGFTAEIQGVPNSPQSISEAGNMASLPAPLPPAFTMDSSSGPSSATPVTDTDGPKTNPTRVDPRCDTDRSPSTAPSSPLRSSIASDYKSAAAEAISRFRPTSRDVIIGVAPHVFDERAKRPNEAPRSNVPLSYYNDQGRVRPSPLRYTIDFDEEEEKTLSSVKPKKSFVSRLAEEFVFGEDSSKSNRARSSTSNLMGSHRASIIDINLDGPPKSKRTKSSPNIKVTSSPTPPAPELPEQEQPPLRSKKWSFLRLGNSGDAQKPKIKPPKPKAEEDCGICYPRCYGECGETTFAKYDRKERRERRARNANKSKTPRAFRDFRDSPEWKEFRETQGLANKMEDTSKDVFAEKTPVPRSKSEGNLKARLEPTLTVVTAVNDSPDSTPEDSPSSSSEDVSVVHGADKDKFRWRSLPGIGGFMLKVKSSKPVKA